MSIAGKVTVNIISADPTQLIRILNENKIEIHNLEYLDELNVLITLKRKDLKFVTEIINKRDETINVQWQSGLYTQLAFLMRRKVFLIAVFIVVVLSIIIPTRILFLKVTGNELVSCRQILDQAEQCGMYFGVSRRAVRSEKIKNALMESIPQLQWIGINTQGCVATISVHEKMIKQEENESFGTVSSIYAQRDAIIKSCTVKRGNLQCVPGQAVVKGQLLVSAYTESGPVIQVSDADAEIYGQTFRVIETAIPSKALMRSEIIHCETKFSLLVGKKLIKLFKDSGISDATCGKMYETKYVTLPGGFQLPFGIRKETIIVYGLELKKIPLIENWLKTYALQYLMEQMIAGSIVLDQMEFYTENDSCRTYGSFVCLELIGQRKEEEIFQKHGEDD